MRSALPHGSWKIPQRPGEYHYLPEPCHKGKYMKQAMIMHMIQNSYFTQHEKNNTGTSTAYGGKVIIIENKHI